MITKTRTVYYCEFCGKHSLRPLEKHESGCTLNPKRRCRLCENANIELNEIVKKYTDKFIIQEIPIEAMGIGGFESSYLKAEYLKDFTWKDIMDDVDGCPVCCLSVLRLIGIISTSHWHRPEVLDGFDYRKLLAEWWEEKAKEAEAREMNAMFR